MKRVLSKKPTTHPELSVVIIGSGESGYVTAAWFDGADAPQAIAAARKCGFQVLELDNAEHKQLAANLPRGRLLKGGRPRLSRVSGPARDTLVQLKHLTSKPADHPTMAGVSDLEKTHATGPGAQPAPEPLAPKRLPAIVRAVAAVRPLPLDFDEVGPGSLVLARDNESEGWYEAIVVLAQGDHFWLRWRDYPRERQIQRERSQLALLYPKAP